MQLKNDTIRFGAVAKTLHWTSAAAFIGAYVVVYYVIWFLTDDDPTFLPVLNIHWVLGILVGTLVLPRLVWRFINIQPAPPPGPAFEHVLADAAHWSLYALMIVMPVTGYLGTTAATDFGLFTIPSFRDTAIFAALADRFGFGWAAFEAPLDVVHHFVGKWVAWVIVTLHVVAALYHHIVRRDDTLIRMLPSVD